MNLEKSNQDSLLRLIISVWVLSLLGPLSIGIFLLPLWGFALVMKAVKAPPSVGIACALLLVLLGFGSTRFLRKKKDACR